MQVVLGVTGGIAAFKAVEVASRLHKLGAEVHVIMTHAATNFVTPLTFREITGNAVATTMWGEVAHFHVEHIALAKLADVFLIVPATANFIAKVAVGMADDMLTTSLLATQAPVYFAPAMNSAMYANPITQKNIQALRQRGWHLLAPKSGPLACGTNGVGRLPEPEEIVTDLENALTKADSWQGKKVIVTAGGTIEPLDPVRFIGNRSSGKMGFALAAEAVARGAEVTLIAGATARPEPPAGVALVRAETALDMRREVLARFAEADVVFKAAAVADYRAKEIAPQKIKKNLTELTLTLEKNPDILQELGARKKIGQILVGFAAETQNLMGYAQEKLKRKHLDFVVANDVTAKGAGFNQDTNLIKVLRKDGALFEFPLLSKRELAKRILDLVENSFMQARTESTNGETHNKLQVQK